MLVVITALKHFPGGPLGRALLHPSWTGLPLTEGSGCGPLRQGPTHPAFLDLGGWRPPPSAGAAPPFTQGVLTAARTCAGPGDPLRPWAGSACAACGSHPPSPGAQSPCPPPSACNPRLSLLMSADLWLPDPGRLSPHSRPSPALPRPRIPGLPHSVCVRVKLLRRVPTLCDPMDCTRLLCPWDSAGKETSMGCRALLQGLFPTQGSNPSLLRLLHWHVGSLLLAPPGKPTTAHCSKIQIAPYRPGLRPLLSLGIRSLPPTRTGLAWSGLTAPCGSGPGLHPVCLVIRAPGTVNIMVSLFVFLFPPSCLWGWTRAQGPFSFFST